MTNSSVFQPGDFSSKIARLHDRSALLKRARHFFDQRNVAEVDCPILSMRAAIDTHIDLISACYQGKERCYMHSSPEFGMKRLLADGMGDIYQLSHVFRDGELSPKHNPEFMMAEWYRIGFTLQEMIDETVQFIRLFVGELPVQMVTYRDLFFKHTGLDYVTAREEELFDYICKQNIAYYPSIRNEGKDALLNLILGAQIEPHLGNEGLCVLAYYPATQAALAQRQWRDDEEVAQRFEVYLKGVELANGYCELGDAEEQQQRFCEANAARLALGKDALPIDALFLAALKTGIPDCCGVAVGFDRLMMIRQGQGDISRVLSWGWEQA